MGFNSIEFAVFFPLVALLYFLMPHRCRWAWLLAASYAFYMFWQPKYALLLLASTLIDFLAGLLLERLQARGWRRLCLAASLAGNLGLLVAFKYWNFLVEGLELAGGPGWASHDWLLPIGLSFYTFQSLSYTFDVYRRERPAERHVGKFALYVAFFPQLVAGPIERSSRLLPQFELPQRAEVARIADGLRRMAWGFFKKLVIADQLGRYVDQIYGDPVGNSGVAVLVATYCFAFQIYCDFSAYTDIAIGASRVLGISLMENFRHPYGASSVAEFWRRWHLSLSTWFRDYVYIPLGGNRRGGWRQAWNLLIVFVLAGLWHGANLTFLAWGLLHAGYLMAGLALRPLRRALATRLEGSPYRRLARGLAVLVTFHCVAAGWLLFRATSLSHAATLVRALGGGDGGWAGTGWRALWDPALLTALPFLLVMQLVERGAEQGRMRALFLGRPAWQRWLVYYALGAVILLFGRADTRTFLYFQF